MTTRYCQECGTAADPVGAFCASCGARLEAPPGGGTGARQPEAPAPRAADRRARSLTVLALASVAAIAILAGGAVVIDRFVPRATPDPASSSGPSVPPTQAAAATAAPITSGEPTATPASPTARPTTVPIATPGPGTSPALVAAETPLGAVAAFFDVRGIRFAGTCARADPVAAAGSYCTDLVDDRESLQVHRVGPVGSEPDTWLLVAAGQDGWAVIEWSPVKSPNASPPF